jgi:hypothetical protein
MLTKDKKVKRKKKCRERPGHILHPTGSMIPGQTGARENPWIREKQDPEKVKVP